MKKPCVIIIALLLVCVAKAQTTYSVPTPTMEERYDNTRDLLYNNILALISIARSQDMTPEELGKEIGYRTRWDADTGFEDLVNFTLYSWACLADDVKIVEQSPEKVVVHVPHVYPKLEDQGYIYGSSLENLIAYLDAMMGEIAKQYHLGCSMSWGDEGLSVEMTNSK